MNKFKIFLGICDIIIIIICLEWLINKFEYPICIFPIIILILKIITFLILFKNENKTTLNNQKNLVEQYSNTLKALETSEKYNIELQLKIKELEDSLQSVITSDLEHHKNLIDKYGEISWQIEELANKKDLDENGISNSLFRQLVRELINKNAKERYNEATSYLKISYGINELEDKFNILVIEALKIAAYGNKTT